MQAACLNTLGAERQGRTELALEPLYEPLTEPECLAEQYIWAAHRYRDYCIFFQVGKFCEFYGRQAEQYSGFFGLTLQPVSRNMQLTTRNLQYFMCGFPIRRLNEFKERAARSAMPYVVIGERGYYASGLKKRVVTEIFRRAR